jgi:hypothetical protein
MRYVVLLRYGLWRLHAALRVSRSEDGQISCVETRAPLAGAVWCADGRFRLTTETGTEHESQRRPLSTISQPLVAYSIPGPKLLDEIPLYAPDVDLGATVQVSAHAVLEEPHRVALQLVLVPRGQEPYHRETVGDRRIDEGAPDIWVVLDRFGDDPPGRVAVAQHTLRWPPPLRAQARP